MPESRIFVIATARNITIQPTRRSFSMGTGTFNLRWLAQGNGVTVENVDFATKSPSAPISDLQEDPDRPGEWIGTWDTANGGLFAYSVQVANNGTNIGPPVDPELENDPITIGDDDKGPKGGG